MVLLKAAGFLAGALNAFRKEKKFCDITLMLGQCQFDAHKCVMAAGSEYFKSLFLGSFVESQETTLDVSKITDDRNLFESVINFLYIGEINVEEDTLLETVKLSSYLLIEKLKNTCVGYMLETLCLENCLLYYFAAFYCGAIELEKKALEIVKVRFHDYILFQGSTLKISDQDMLCLYKTGVLEFCTVPSLLCFLADWVGSCPCNCRIAVGAEILDHCQVIVENTAASVYNHTDYSFKSMLETLMVKPEMTETSEGTNFIWKFETVVQQYRGGGNAKRQRSVMHNISSLDFKPEPSQESTEKVIISVSPKEELKADRKKFYDSKQSNGEIRYSPVIQFPDGVPIYDVCVYFPVTKSWFYLQSAEDKNGFHRFGDNNYWGYKCMTDKLYCWHPYGLNIYNLRDTSWHELEPFATCDFLKLKSNEDISPHEFETLYTPEYNVFMIHKICARDSSQIFFQCYKLNVDDSWDLLFSSPKIDTENRSGFSFSALSPDGTKLLINIYRPDLKALYCSFVTDLSMLEPVPTQVYPETGNNFIDNRQPEDTSSGTYILTGKDRFYLIFSNSVKNDQLTLSCKYQLKYSSKSLSGFKGREVTIEKCAVDIEHGAMYPCLYRRSAEGSLSVWIFSGNRENINMLAEVTVDESGELLVIYHTPPPFENVTALCEGFISRDVLQNLKPVHKYLMPDF